MTYFRSRWWWSALVPLTLAAIVFLIVRAQVIMSPLGPGRVKAVEAGDQEIAWITPATSGENWERLVKAVRLLAEQWPQTHGGPPLQLNTSRAFLPMTADVPEIGLSFEGSGTLWIRWYKLSGGNNSEHWVTALQSRATPPLAIIGGDTSDRALRLATLLKNAQSKWSGPDPLLLITTATAQRYLPPDRPDLERNPDNWPKLMDLYPGRSFRFSFTNPRMVEAVLDFVQTRPNLWADPLGDSNAPFYLITLTWLDDGYSKDLSNSFQKLYTRSIRDKFGPEEVLPIDEDFINYSIGDYYQPNPREEMQVGLFLANRARRGARRELLVLPTGAQRARRFLRTLSRRAPAEVRNIVVANGDAISFNSLYRDRDLAWNVQDVPIPLVVFSHRDPIDKVAGFDAKDPVTGRHDITSTQDLLLYRDLVEAVVLSCFKDGALLTNPDDVLARLKDVRWDKTHVMLGGGAGGGGGEGSPFFDREGDRTAGTGEHVVWLEPIYEGYRVLPESNLHVYRLSKLGPPSVWEAAGPPLRVSYDRSSEGAGHVR